MRTTNQASLGWAMRASDAAARARTPKVDLMMSVMECLVYEVMSAGSTRHGTGRHSQRCWVWILVRGLYLLVMMMKNGGRGEKTQLRKQCDGRLTPALACFANLPALYERGRLPERQCSYL